MRMPTAGRKPFRRRYCGGLAGDDNAHWMDLRLLQFLLRLRLVAAIGKEDAGTLRDQQSRRTPGEAGEIIDIGKVRNQQSIELVVGERGLEAAQAAGVIHRRSVARSSSQFPVLSSQNKLLLRTGN